MGKNPSLHCVAFLVAILTLVFHQSAFASRITLAWDPSTGATGYRVYLGRASGTYEATIDVGNTRTCALTNLSPGQRYFFAVTARNAFGESGLSAEVSGIAPYDFNDDRRTDILWRNRSTGQSAVWLMKGTDLVSDASLLPVADANWEIVGTADFNGDGQVDLLWRNRSTGENSVWFMSGTNLGSGVSLPRVADLNWKIVGTADFNGDGQADLVWRNQSTGQNSVWFMSGTALVSGVSLLPVVDSNWEVVSTADFNSDGKVDLLWRNQSTGQNSVWLMNGTSLVSNVSLLPVVDPNWEIVGPK